MSALSTTSSSTVSIIASSLRKALRVALLSKAGETLHPGVDWPFFAPVTPDCSQPLDKVKPMLPATDYSSLSAFLFKQDVKASLKEAR